MNRSGLGICDRKTSGYFLTSVASGYFRFISGYVLSDYQYINIYRSWSSGPVAAPKPPSQVSADISISCRNSASGLYSVSGSTFIPRPPRTRDRVTNAEAGPATRTGHSGCRIGLPGRWDGTQLTRQISVTYVTVWIRVHIGYW